MKIRIALLSFVCALGAFSQVNKSNLVGVVRDSTGAAVPGVNIKITNAIRSSATQGYPSIKIVDCPEDSVS